MVIALAFVFALRRNDGGPAAGLSLDREDNDGGYWCGRCTECVASGRPANVAWKTPKQQNANRRTIRQLSRERDALATRVAELEAVVTVLRAKLAG